MPLTRSAQQAQEADTVRSRPNRAGYHVPSKQACIDHLCTVQLRLSDPKLTAAKRAVLVEDLDALLSRLSWHLTVDSATTVANP